VLVSGNDSPVTIVLSSSLLESQLKCLSILLDTLDSAILVDWDTILVEGELRFSSDKDSYFVWLFNSTLDICDRLLELGDSSKAELGLSRGLSKIIVELSFIGTGIISSDVVDDDGNSLRIRIHKPVSISSFQGLAILCPFDVRPGVSLHLQLHHC